MTRTRHIAVLVGLAVALAFAGPARADGEDLARGIELYQELEYERATGALEEAVDDPGLNDEDRIRGFRYLALSYLALRRTEDARDAFRRLLEIDREFELPATASQTARALLDEVRRSLPPAEDEAEAGGAVELTHTATPASPDPQQGVTLSIRVADPGGRHDRVIVHHRPHGQASYSTIIAVPRSDMRYLAKISGAFVSAPRLQYYVTAVDADGEALGSEGSAGSPLELVVGSGDDPVAAAPVYERWWFWASVGGAIVAGGLGVWALTGDDGTPESTVTITVDGP